MTLEEARILRNRLREIGIVEFLAETAERKIPARKLCTAFGILPPEFLEGSPDEAYISSLLIGIKREWSKRLKLPEYNTVEDAVELLKRSKNIIVLTGAGVGFSQLLWQIDSSLIGQLRSLRV